jgi:hypothetical protein
VLRKFFQTISLVNQLIFHEKVPKNQKKFSKNKKDLRAGIFRLNCEDKWHDEPSVKQFTSWHDALCGVGGGGKFGVYQ